mgnify:CR=1 FL=1
MGLSILCLLTLFVFPMWKITLVAPQYPEGISMNIWINKMTGEELGTLQNINILNHYVGMKYIEPDAIPELVYFPYVIMTMCFLGLGAIAWDKPEVYLIWTILFVILSCLGLYDFYLWEHDYGHDLDPKAIMKFTNPDGSVMGFQPPLFGSKDILNFKAHSYPRLGALFLGLGIAASLFAYLVGKKKSKKP